MKNNVICQWLHDHKWIVFGIAEAAFDFYSTDFNSTDYDSSRWGYTLTLLFPHSNFYFIFPPSVSVQLSYTIHMHRINMLLNGVNQNKTCFILMRFSAILFCFRVTSYWSVLILRFSFTSFHWHIRVMWANGRAVFS